VEFGALMVVVVVVAAAAAVAVEALGARHQQGAGCGVLSGSVNAPPTLRAQLVQLNSHCLVVTRTIRDCDCRAALRSGYHW
jgi:uncharacterized transporter YbjL